MKVLCLMFLKISTLFLGVNVQFVKNRKLIIRSLGMITMKERQTSENIKSEVKNILSKFDTTLDQVFAVTVVNGSNMIKSVTLIEDEINEVQISDTTDFEDSLLEDENNEEMVYDAVDCNNLPCMRCAAHTLQLAVNEILKNDVFKRIIKSLREIAKKCRNVKYEYLFKQSNVPYPRLDVETRWGSTYIMLQGLYDNESFFKSLGSTYNELDISFDHWIFLKKYVQALKPIYITTLKFQEEQMHSAAF